MSVQVQPRQTLLDDPVNLPVPPPLILPSGVEALPQGVAVGGVIVEDRHEVVQLIGRGDEHRLVGGIMLEVTEVGVGAGPPVRQRIILAQMPDEIGDPVAELPPHVLLAVALRDILEGVVEERGNLDVLILRVLRDEVVDCQEMRDVRDAGALAHVIPVVDGCGVHRAHEAGCEGRGHGNERRGRVRPGGGMTEALHLVVEGFVPVRQTSRNIYEVLSSAAEPFKTTQLPGLMR